MKTEIPDIEAIKQKVISQSEYLNSFLGILLFTLGLTSLGFPDPKLAAYTCLGIIIPLYIKAIYMTPSSLYALRQLVKQEADPHAIEILRYLENNFVGFRVFFTRNFTFWYGIVFFVVVAIRPEWLFWLRT
ncbi:hypothetical protein [Vibrio metschnikovii]|uniref:hypothetical protein n=1 Tax=Vibrio metschnikovii TaxID=28172 RepID=UPI001C30B05B|nr:hypothetical protein [Vibrio metschnikovii]